jgi:ferrous iron transport protein B
MDKIMRKFGLSGKCGAAYFWNCLCYSCYNGHKKHRNWKERLITILVTPFTTCSRLPVYAIIALVIPDERLFGFLNMQGMTLMLLYLLF